MNTVVIITGSRSITDRESIFKVLDQEIDPRSVAYFYQGEAQGVDLISRDWCNIHHVRCIGVPATSQDWQKYGPGAGNVRNQQMLDKAIKQARLGGYALKGIALWDGSSTGTKDMIERLRRANIETVVRLMGKPKTKRLI